MMKSTNKQTKKMNHTVDFFFWKKDSNSSSIHLWLIVVVVAVFPVFFSICCHLILFFISKKKVDVQHNITNATCLSSKHPNIRKVVVHNSVINFLPLQLVCVAIFFFGWIVWIHRNENRNFSKKKITRQINSNNNKKTLINKWRKRPKSAVDDSVCVRRKS